MHHVKLFTLLAIFLFSVSTVFSPNLYAQNEQGQPKTPPKKGGKPPINGGPTIIIGDPEGDPCRHAPELEECGGDGGEPGDPKEPKDPEESETPTPPSV